MSTKVVVLGDSQVCLWGLSSSDRLRRQVKQLPAEALLENPDEIQAGEAVLLVHAAYLFEVRTMQNMLDFTDSDMAVGGHQQAKLLQCPADGKVAAALISGDALQRIMPLVGEAAPELADEVELLTPDRLAAFDPNLRRSEPPLLESLELAEVGDLESKLYGNSYKGITDLVTKWWWPRPARVGVAVCAKWHITPNAVTLTGVALMFAACWLFAYGFYGWGLLAGWIMTFLDTVDGKLARVTVQSSRIGHVLDHGMDLLHPPFWYVIWGLSLVNFTPPFGLDVYQLPLWIFGGYAAGRIAEGIFQLIFTWGIFTWRPLDSYFRLITARRNPCMILLTLAVVVGRPDWGYLAVLAWTVFTSGLLIIRLVHAIFVRMIRGPLTPWLTEPGVATGPNARAYRTFSGTRSAYES